MTPFRRLYLLALLALHSGLTAAVSLDPLFGDHAVILAGTDVPVWGSADEGEKVTVRLADAEASAVTEKGRWQVRFPSLKSSTTPADLVAVGASTTATSTDVLIGEVWLCAGQSNMALRLNEISPADQAEAVATGLPTLRYYAVAKKREAKPLAKVAGKWQVAAGPTVVQSSAVAYYFGRALVEAGVGPVGVIDSSYGNTYAEGWTSDEALRAVPELAGVFARFADDIVTFPKRLADYQQAKAAHELAAAAAKAAGKPAPRAPRAVVDPQVSQFSPSRLYNAMIAPIIPVAIRGVVWYQGENNNSRPREYQTLLPTLIADWRARWGRGDFPFYIVQVAPFKGMPPEIREAQFRVSEKVANSGIVSTLDVGEAANIHPLNKRPVGERLARLARAGVYRQTVVTSGPRYRALTIQGNTATVAFTHADGGLAATGGTLKGFTVAGADQRFVDATAVIRNGAVEVSSPAVPAPVAVRYAWANAPEATLVNGEGLPSFPFRSDDWPVTADK
jgi:sialate O-acetylesterase